MLSAPLALHLANTCLSLSSRKLGVADIARLLGTLGAAMTQTEDTDLLRQRDIVLHSLYAYFAQVLVELKNKDITPQVSERERECVCVCVLNCL